MPKVWLSYDFSFGEFVVWDQKPLPGSAASEVVEVDMNNSLYRQIRAAEKKYIKFQDLLSKFFKEAQQHPNTVRRVK